LTEIFRQAYFKPGPDHAVQNNGLSLTESGTLIRVFLKQKIEKQQNLLVCLQKKSETRASVAQPRYLNAEFYREI